MDKLIPNLYSEYGKYVNQFRSFPYINDGLKLVERRLLYSLYELAKDKYAKSAKIVGHCIGNYHPHGDTSAYGTLVNIVYNNWAIGQGNWGCRVGIEHEPAAAMRYTEVKMSKNMLIDCFEYIKLIELQESELEDEPLNLPVKLPMCLTGNVTCQGIGVGYSTMIPCYKKTDLIKRLNWLLTNQGKEPIIKPKSNCIITSTKSELQSLLTTGYSKINFEGKFEVIDNKNIIIKSIPESRTFQTILNKFSKEIGIDKSLGWRDDSSKETSIILSIIKPRSLKMEALKKKLKTALKGSITYQCHMYNEDGKVQLVSIDDMLLNIYNRYKYVVKLSIDNEILKNKNLILELELIAKIKPLLSAELKINPDDINKAICNISKGLNTQQKIIREIFDRYNITRIFKIKTDVTKYNDTINILNKRLNQLTKYIWKEKYMTIK